MVQAQVQVPVLIQLFILMVMVLALTRLLKPVQVACLYRYPA
jgi:hypothetical protein